MALVELTRAEQEEFRDAAEVAVSRAVDAATRAWLADVLAAIRGGLREGLPADSLVAAGAELPLNLGTMSRWWADRVNGGVATAIRAVWEQAYVRTRPGELLSSSLDRLDTFMAAVSDRLVRGLVPPLPDDAMDRVRYVITQSAALGWSTQRTSQNIATALSWEQDGRALRREYDRLTGDIEAILDPLGPPGTPAREAARTGDPRVRALQDLRAQTVTALDSEKSHWQVRADRIARTESTAAYNFANLTALADEGWTHKEWMATRDTRTREAHVDLDGQVVPVAEPFIVDGLPIMMPGDPSAAAFLTVNCRCILVGADAPPGEVEPTAAQITQETARALEQALPAPAPAPTTNAAPVPASASQVIPFAQRVPALRGEPTREARVAAEALFTDFTSQINDAWAGQGVVANRITHSVDKGRVKMSWTLVDANGAHVGSLSRQVRRLPDGPVVVENTFFGLTPEAQGGGLANNLAARLEDWYRRSGVTAVVVHANIDVGGYTWARQGFEWDPEIQGWADVKRLLQRFWEYASARDQVDLWRAAVENNKDNPDAWPSPYELAMFGWEGRLPDPKRPGKETWVGQRAMLNTDWYGRKPLGEEPA
jgi:GNAT superfamily N-acetyltransferase